MNEIDRRNLLMMSSAGAAALGLGSGEAEADGQGDGPRRAVRLHGDGLGLTPSEYAACLGELGAPANPIEQPGIQLDFKRGDAFADRRLCHVQRLGAL